MVHGPARPALAQAAPPQAAANASCPTARRRGQLRRGNRAAASGQGSKVRVREIRGPRANAGPHSGPLQRRRLKRPWREDEARLQAFRLRDRARLPPGRADRNRPQPPAQRREEVAPHREAQAAGAKSRGSPCAAGYRAPARVLDDGRPHRSGCSVSHSALRPHPRHTALRILRRRSAT